MIDVEPVMRAERAGERKSSFQGGGRMLALEREVDILKALMAELLASKG